MSRYQINKWKRVKVEKECSLSGTHNSFGKFWSEGHTRTKGRQTKSTELCRQRWEAIPTPVTVTHAGAGIGVFSICQCVSHMISTSRLNGHDKRERLNIQPRSLFWVRLPLTRPFGTNVPPHLPLPFLAKKTGVRGYFKCKKGVILVVIVETIIIRWYLIVEGKKGIKLGNPLNRPVVCSTKNFLNSCNWRATIVKTSNEFLK